jgi:hypothetical protein
VKAAHGAALGCIDAGASGPEPSTPHRKALDGA